MEGRSSGNLSDPTPHGYSRNDALAQLPATFGLPLSIQVSRAAASAQGNYSDQTDRCPFPNGLLTNRDVRSPDQTAPTTGSIFPHSRYNSSSDINNSNTGFAVRLLKPQPTLEGVVFIERRNHVHLDIDLPLRLWNAIQLPSTKSVKIGDSYLLGEYLRPLLLDITVRGATTWQEYNRVCRECEERVGNTLGPSSLIDFHSSSNIIRPRGRTVGVHFTFSCYSRHHRREDEQYVYVAVAQ